MVVPAYTRTSSLGEHTRLTGEIHGQGGLVIEGRVKGDVRVSGALTIAKTGAVEGSVSAESVKIEGVLEGTVVVSGAIAIGSSASVRGRLRGASISVEPGAEISIDLEQEPGPRRSALESQAPAEPERAELL